MSRRGRRAEAACNYSAEGAFKRCVTAAIYDRIPCGAFPGEDDCPLASAGHGTRPSKKAHGEKCGPLRLPCTRMAWRRQIFEYPVGVYVN
ncbi:unnamed protein product, partial [Iphiclides podalirius]